MVTLKKLKLATKPRILLIQGSPRYVDNCPGQSGKTNLLAEYLIENAPEGVEIDFLDLSIKGDGNIVQPCKACISTGGGIHCHYPCDCYVAGSKEFPDLMHNDNVYGRLEAADGFLVLSPVHWYAVSGQVKALFDRLVCTNLTLTTEQAEEIGVGKDPVKSRELEQSGEFTHLLRNHYEGKYGAFLIHGDNGGADYAVHDLPESFTRHMTKKGDEGWVNDPKNSVMNLVWQCRYSGIFVPDDLIVGFHATTDISYSEAMDLAISNLDSFYAEGLGLLNKLCGYLA